MIDINVLKMMNLPEGSPNQKTCYFQQKIKKKKNSFHIRNNVTNIERGWSCEKERCVWGKGSENKRVGIKAGGLKRREEQFLFIQGPFELSLFLLKLKTLQLNNF